MITKKGKKMYMGNKRLHIIFKNQHAQEFNCNEKSHSPKNDSESREQLIYFIRFLPFRNLNSYMEIFTNQHT